MNKKFWKIVLVLVLGVLGVLGCGVMLGGEAMADTEIDITIPDDIIDGGGSGGSGSGGSGGSDGGHSSGSHSFGGGDATTDIVVDDDVPGSTEEGMKDLDKRLECDNIVKESGTKIGAMQWILCPSMDNSRYTATWVDNLTQDWLEQDTEDYKPGSAAEIGWGYVRNIANVVMVIFLMIVIFSQLTGRGIDNYGIKKMLPRLIVMAIVVNLSFYICVVLVDLSNIAGEGLRNMFGSIGTQIAGDQQVTGAPFLGAMIAGLFSAAGGAGAAVGAGLTVAGLGLTATALVPVIIAVVVLCLIILAAVMTLFLMLGARRIIVIFCIVIAPLAFAAFILPNTQNLFKKWWELLKTALIIFPICGALGGISYMLRAIALTGNARYSVVELILLMLLPYLSFFLLPMLLKNALSALGKLGGALTSMGNTIRNGGRAIGQGAMRVAQNTEGYKRAQEQAAMRRQQRWAENYTRRHGTGDQIAKQIEDAKRRAADPNATDRERRQANRELRTLQRRALLSNQATQIQMKNMVEQEMADIGGTVAVPEEAIHARAVSAREAQEMKSYTDQYSALSPEDMRNELERAANAYSIDRSDTNATRLRAAVAAAQSKGLYSPTLQRLNALNLTDANLNDQKILNDVNYGNLYGNLTRSELANELQTAVNAYNTDRSDSNTRRLQNIIKVADGRSMDKEMLDYLGGLNLRAVDAQGNATNDARILDTLSAVNNKVVKQYGIQMGKPANVQQSMTMNQFADSTGPVKLSEALAGKGVDYLNDTNDDILGYIADHSMSSGSYSPVISSDTLASITANTTDEKVLRKAREIYNNMDANAISFSGNQLARYDIDTLRQIATKITPNSQLQRNFVAATNDIARTPDLISNLKPEQRALFKAIRRGAGINDSLFD